jgi:hypothetical protein
MVERGVIQKVGFYMFGKGRGRKFNNSWKGRSQEEWHEVRLSRRSRKEEELRSTRLK